MASHCIQLHNEEISYLLLRSPRRRSIGLRIDLTGLTVSVPARLPRNAWEMVLAEKSTWILAKLAHMRTRVTPPLIWQTGQALPFLGSTIELAVELGSARTWPKLADGVLSVFMPDASNEDALKTRVLQWYRREALELFQHRVTVYSRQLDVKVSRLSLSNARTRWGSCTHQGGIRLNWRLIKAPPAVIDYVVAHELAHRIEMNHSPAFWRTVAQLCPDYPDLRTALKAQSMFYHHF